MAITYKVVDGEVIATETKETIVTSMTKDDLEGKKREIQTKIDHIDIDRAALVADLAELDNQIALLEK